LIKNWPARELESEQGTTRQGLPLRLAIRREGALAELDLGDASKFWPCDEALAYFNIDAGAPAQPDALARIVYEA